MVTWNMDTRYERPDNTENAKSLAEHIGIDVEELLSIITRAQDYACEMQFGIPSICSDFHVN